MTKPFQFPVYDTTLSIAALTAIYNGLADHPIKKFSDKSDAMKRLGRLEREHMIAWLIAHSKNSLTSGALADYSNSQLRALISASRPAPVTKAKDEARPAKRTGVGAAVVGWLKDGLSTEKIIELVATNYPTSAPGADPKVARKHIAWYKSHMSKA